MASKIERIIVPLLNDHRPLVRFVLARDGEPLPAPLDGVYTLILHGMEPAPEDTQPCPPSAPKMPFSLHF